MTTREGSGRITADAEISEDIPQGLKPSNLGALCGTTEVVPFHQALRDWRITADAGSNEEQVQVLRFAQDDKSMGEVVP
jgi:hypothetical protein